MAESIRLAIIGSGKWARKYHFPALEHLRRDSTAPAMLCLHGIHSQDRSSAAEVAGEYHFERVYDSPEEVVADGAVDAVAIELGYDIHASQCDRQGAHEDHGDHTFHL